MVQTLSSTFRCWASAALLQSTSLQMLWFYSLPTAYRVHVNKARQNHAATQSNLKKCIQRFFNILCALFCRTHLHQTAAAYPRKAMINQHQVVAGSFGSQSGQQCLHKAQLWSNMQHTMHTKSSYKCFISADCLWCLPRSYKEPAITSDHLQASQFNQVVIGLDVRHFQWKSKAPPHKNEPCWTWSGSNTTNHDDLRPQHSSSVLRLLWCAVSHHH